MGARGMGRLRRAMLGSVSHEVLHAAAVPVTIVKMPLMPMPTDAGEIDSDSAA